MFFNGKIFKLNVIHNPIQNIKPSEISWLTQNLEALSPACYQLDLVQPSLSPTSAELTASSGRSSETSLSIWTSCQCCVSICTVTLLSRMLLWFSVAACKVLSFSALFVEPVFLCSSYTGLLLVSTSAQFVLFFCALLILLLISFPSLPVQSFPLPPNTYLVKWLNFLHVPIAFIPQL